MTATRTGEMPVAEAVRRPGRGFLDPPTWTVKRCPYCRRRHTHVADVVLSELVLPARCGGGGRFYLVRVEET